MGPLASPSPVGGASSTAPGVTTSGGGTMGQLGGGGHFTSDLDVTSAVTSGPAPSPPQAPSAPASDPSEPGPAPDDDPGAVAVVVDSLAPATGVVDGLVARLGDHGYRPVVHVGPGPDVRDWDARSLDAAFGDTLGPVLGPVFAASRDRRRLTGVVAVAGPGGSLPHALPQAWGDLPVVLVGGRSPGHASVVGDEAEAMDALVAHLVDEAGARRFSFVGGAPSGPGRERGEAFLAACSSRGLRVEERALVSNVVGRLPAYKATVELFRATPDIDAVVAVDDDTALGVLDAMVELGVDVPGRVRVAGFGDDPRAARSRPPLTTVDLRAVDQGRAAADLLVSQLSGSPGAREEVVAPAVVVRRSTVVRPPALRSVPGPSPGWDARTGAPPDLLGYVEAAAGPAPQLVDRAWAHTWLGRLRRQMESGNLDEGWVRSWSRPVGSVEEVELATEWLAAASRAVHDVVSGAVGPAERSGATDVHGRVVSRLARAAADRARAAERADLLSARHVLSLSRSLDRSESSDEALQALGGELGQLGVRRLAVLLPDPATTGRARVALVYDEGRVLTGGEGAGTPALGSAGPGSDVDAPVIVRPLVGSGRPLGLLAYEPVREGGPRGGWAADAVPDDVATALARALDRDTWQARLTELEGSLGEATGRLQAEKARRVAAEEELRRATRELARSQTVDPLTGINNRASLDEVLVREWQAHAFSRRPLALVMVDIDHFKAYNDRYGHLQGDVTLRAVAGLLRQSGQRMGDIAARYGGEEFALVLPDTDLPGAERVASSVLEAVRDAGIPHDAADTPHVTVSAGAAVCHPASEDLEIADLLRAADEALYQAKAEGRDRMATGTPSPARPRGGHATLPPGQPAPAEIEGGSTGYGSPPGRRRDRALPAGQGAAPQGEPSPEAAPPGAEVGLPPPGPRPPGRGRRART